MHRIYRVNHRRQVVDLLETEQACAAELHYLALCQLRTPNAQFVKIQSDDAKVAAADYALARAFEGARERVQTRHNQLWSRDPETFEGPTAEQLDALIIQTGKTIAELTRILGFSESMLRKWRNGSTRMHMTAFAYLLIICGLDPAFRQVEQPRMAGRVTMLAVDRRTVAGRTRAPAKPSRKEAWEMRR